jgi:hypothetical protein
MPLPETVHGPGVLDLGIGVVRIQPPESLATTTVVLLIIDGGRPVPRSADQPSDLRTLEPHCDTPDPH